MKKKELLILVRKMTEGETPEERESAFLEFEKLKQYDVLSSLSSIIAENQSGELEYDKNISAAINAMLTLAMQGSRKAILMIKRYIKSDDISTMVITKAVCHQWGSSNPEIKEWIDYWVGG